MSELSAELLKKFPNLSIKLFCGGGEALCRDGKESKCGNVMNVITTRVVGGKETVTDFGKKSDSCKKCGGRLKS